MSGKNLLNDDDKKLLILIIFIIIYSLCKETLSCIHAGNYNYSNVYRSIILIKKIQ